MKQYKQLKIGLALGISLFARPASAVTFNVEFESPSRWDNAEYNQAKEYIKEFLNELGDELASDALVGVYITDDSTGATSGEAASAISAPESTFISRDNKLEFAATVAWKRINKEYTRHGEYQDDTGEFVEIPNNGDVAISYNFSQTKLSVNDHDSLGNLKTSVRGLLRHEIMHALGMSGSSQGPGTKKHSQLFLKARYITINTAPA